MVFDEFYLYFIYDGDGFVEGVVIVVSCVEDFNIDLLFVVDEGFVLDVVLMDCVGFYVIVIVVDIVVMVYCKIFDGDLIIEVVEVVIFFGLEDLEIVFGDF